MNISRKSIPASYRKRMKYWYAKIPIKWRMGGNYWDFSRFLQEAQWWAFEKMKTWQLRKLKAIVKHIYENVSAYHELYRQQKISPAEIQRIEDIQLLLFVTKELLRDIQVDFTAKNIPKGQLHYVTTDTSTGIPFGFFQTDINGWAENAFIHSGWR